MGLQQTLIPDSNNEDSYNIFSNNSLWHENGKRHLDGFSYRNSINNLPVKAPLFKQFSDLYAGIQSLSQENLNVMNSKIPPDLMDVIREMTTLLIHRYRSPLTGIMGFVDLMKMNSDNINEHYMETIISGLHEMSGLLDEMEDLSHEKVANLKPLSLVELFGNILDEYPKHERSRVHIFDDSRNKRIYADRTLFKTVLTELIDNSLDHDRTANTDVIIEIPEESNITITNFGSPIPADFTLKMFYPFYSTKSRNMGLGLTKASIAAQAQNWIIELVSNSEVDGICFEIRPESSK